MSTQLDNASATDTTVATDKWTPVNTDGIPIIHDDVDAHLVGTLDDLEEWLDRTGAHRLLLSHRAVMLEGEAGSGKSSLLASLVPKVHFFWPHRKVFYHFIGAAPGSTDLTNLLRRMWLEIWPGKAMPPTEDKLVQSTRALLAHAGVNGGWVGGMESSEW